MPASLALVKAYWSGEQRQRAISLWSMGSWGGSGFAALFGGLMAENVGWRWIFIIAALVSLIGMLMVRGTPESKAPPKPGYKFDLGGVLTFMIAMVALQIFATQGASFGWGSPATLGLLATAIVFGIFFYKIESGNPNAFVQFRLFKNLTYTGATISNLLLNATAGIIMVAMLLLQQGGSMSAQKAGLLTIGYAITIMAFIRVGEKLLQRFGPRKPMLWGCYIVGLSIVLLMPTNLMLGSYTVLAVISFALSGLVWLSMPRPQPMPPFPTCLKIRPVPGRVFTKWPHHWGPLSGWPFHRPFTPPLPVPMRACAGLKGLSPSLAFRKTWPRARRPCLPWLPI